MNPFFTCLLLPFLLNPASKRTKRHLHKIPNSSLIFPNLFTISLFHTVGYKNHSAGYIFHSVGYKNHTVKQNYFLEKKQYVCLRFHLYQTVNTSIFSAPSSIACMPLISLFSTSETFFSTKSNERNKKIRYIYHKELL